MLELGAPVRGARARLRLVGHGARDAPHPGRVHRAAWCGHAVLRPLHARQPRRAAGARRVDHVGERHVRRHALEHLRGRGRRRSHDAREGRDDGVVRRARRRAARDVPARAPMPRRAIRCSCCSRKASTRSSRAAPGTRSACAARAAPARSSPARAAPSRSCRVASPIRRRRRWCRTRTSCGPRCGPASPPTRIGRAAAVRARRGAQAARAPCRRMRRGSRARMSTCSRCATTGKPARCEFDELTAENDAAARDELGSMGWALQASTSSR